MTQDDDLDIMTDAQVAHRDRIMAWLKLTDEQQIAALEHVTRTPSPASPSPVADGQLEALLKDFLYGKRNLTETADAIRSSQAPKPASAGGVRVVSQAVLQAAYENVPTCQGGYTSEFIRGWSSCLAYLARTVAAEADTATKGEPWVCPAGFCERHGVIHV